MAHLPARHKAPLEQPALHQLPNPLPDRDPEDPGRLHRDMGATPVAQPLRQRAQLHRGRPELQDLRFDLSVPEHSATASHHHLLVDVQTPDTLVNYFHDFTYHLAISFRTNRWESARLRHSPQRSSGAYRRDSFGHVCATRDKLLIELKLRYLTTSLHRSSCPILPHILNFITHPRFIVSGRRHAT